MKDDTKTKDDKITFVYACEEGFLEIVKLLVSSKKVKIDDMMYTLRGFMAACKKGHLEIVDFLLKSGVPMDFYDGAGATPFSASLSAKHYHIVSLLLETCKKQAVLDEFKKYDTAIDDFEKQIVDLKNAIFLLEASKKQAVVDALKKRDTTIEDFKEKVSELERKLKQKERSPHGKERHYC